MQTVCICFILGFGAMSFSRDSNELVLAPIERMIAKMNRIKENPLIAMRLGDIEYRRQEKEAREREQKLASKKKKTMYKVCKWLCRRRWERFYMRRIHTQNEPMETVVLEKTIIKLGALLALGFGEAGAAVIGENMKVGREAGFLEEAASLRACSLRV